MLLVISALQGYAIQATDGRIGTVSDFLFDETTWKVRWLVVDTGSWLPGRQVLIHPSALGHVDWAQQILPVNLTKQQVEGSPDLQQDLPVSRQMEDTLYSYYGWDPYWGGDSYFGMGAGASPYLGDTLAAATAGLVVNNGDPHLRSVARVTGYHIHATDGDIGHVEKVLIDDATWQIRYLIVDTSNWWFGQHVLVSPFAVTDIRWQDELVRLNVSCAQVKASPPWKPLDAVDAAYEKQLHQHYDWPGYGW
jgi:sporulation protein YlmC with PRC-barrel domain